MGITTFLDRDPILSPDELHALLEDSTVLDGLRSDGLDAMSLRDILHAMVDAMARQRARMDTLASRTDAILRTTNTLTARLYGDGSEGPSQGDVPVLRRDVLELMRAEASRVVGPGRVHCTTDERSMYHALTGQEGRS